MSDRIRDVLVLLATDDAAARAFEHDPEDLLARYGLDAGDVAVLRSLRLERRASAPRRLEERLSRSGMGFAATLHDASASADAGPDDGGGSDAAHAEDGGSHGPSRHSSDESSRDPDPDDGEREHDERRGGGHDDGGHGASEEGDGRGTGSRSGAATAAPVAAPAAPVVPSPGSVDDGGGDAPTSGSPSDASGPGNHPSDGRTADDLWHSLDARDDARDDVHDGGEPAADPSPTPGSSGSPPVEGPVREVGPSQQWGPFGPATTVPSGPGAAPVTAGAPDGPATAHPGPSDTGRPEHPGSAPDDDARAGDPDQAVPAVVPPPRPEGPVTGPAGTYRGGVVAQQALPGADGGLRVTYADGSQRDVTRTVVDGEVTDTYTTADGARATETYGPDGGWTVAERDGSTTIATRAGGILTEEVHGPDGTVATTQATLFGRFSGMHVLEGQEQFSTTTTGPDGGVVAVRVLGTADGGAVAITSDPPATATTRVALVDVDNPDGSVTRTFTFPDGRTEAFTVNTAGEVLAHEIHVTGGRYTPTALPDTGYGGGVVLEIRHEETPDVIEQHLGDGTVREVTRAADLTGVVHDRWSEPDGSTVVATVGSVPATTTVTAPDGTSTVLTDDAGEATRTVTTPDGATRTATASGFTPGSEILRSSAETPPVGTSVVLDADGTGALATITTATGIEHARVAITDVPNPDGSTTHLLRFPDGRTEVITTDVGGGAVALESRPGTGGPARPPGDPAADVNGSYHGGTLREETTTDPVTGAEVVTRTFADGTAVEIGPDGSYTSPDGSRVTEQVWSDGVSGMTTTEAPDGTVTQDSFDPTSFTSGVNRPDGSSSSTTWGGDPAGALFATVDTDPDGRQTITTVAPLVDGGGLATITRDGTAVTVRVDVDEVGNVDGTTTRVYTFPDGRTEAFTVDALGAAVHHESHPGSGSPAGDLGPADDDGYRDGIVAEKVLVEQGAPGEPVEVPILDPDGTPTGLVRYEDAVPATPATVEVLRADGTTQEIQRYTDPDGEVYESWVEPDGTRVSSHVDETDGVSGTSTEVGADGSSTLRRWDGVEGFREDRTDLDGTTTRFRIPLDGSVPPPGGEIFSTVQVTATGQAITTSVVATADGGAAAVSTRADGASVTARLDVIEVGNPDGSTTRVYAFPDGRTEAVTVDGRTGAVIAHEGVPAGGEVPPAASSGTAPRVTVTVEPDGDRVEVRTHADGTVETVTTTPTGTWVSEATDASGTTLRTEVLDDGSLARTVVLADGSSTEVTRAPGSTIIVAIAVDGTEATHTASEDGRIESSVHDPATGRTVITAHEADGTESQTLLGPDGRSTTVAVAPDGTETRTLVGPEGDREVDTLLPDGTVRIETDLDGRHLVAEHRPDGVATQTETVPTASGGTSTSTVTKHPDGLIEQRTDDGAGTTETLTTRADQTWTQVTRKPDGTTVEQSLTADRRLVTRQTEPDGSWAASELHEDGSRIDTARDAQGSETHREVAPDGTWHATLDNRDGITETWLDGDGSQRTRLTTPNGDYTEVHEFTNGDRRVTHHTDPGAHSFGVGQVPSGPSPVEKVFGISLRPPDNPVELVTRLENANGNVFTEVTYQDGSRLTVDDPPGGVDPGTATIIGDQNILFVQKFDADGALVVDKPVIGAPGPPPTSTPPPDLPPLEPAGVKVAESFSQAFALTGTVSGSFDAGVFSGDFSAEGTLGFSHSGAVSLQAGPDGVDAAFSQQILLGAQGRLSGSLTTPLGTLAGSMSASASMYASAVGMAHIGLDGVQASFSADAMIAAKAGLEAGGDLVLGSGHLGAEVGVGLGAHVDADLEVSTDRIGFGFGAGVGLGVLLGADVDLSFSPSGLADDIADDPVGTIGGLLAAAGGRNTDSAGRYVVSSVLASATGAPGVVVVATTEVITEGLKAVGDALEDVPVAGEIVGFVEDVGDVIGDGVDAVGSLLPWNW